MRNMAQYIVLLTEIGLTIAASVLVGYYLGTRIDALVGTQLVFTMLGAALGVGSGFYSAYRLISKQLEKSER